MTTYGRTRLVSGAGGAGSTTTTTTILTTNNNQSVTSSSNGASRKKQHQQQHKTLRDSSSDSEDAATGNLGVREKNLSKHHVGSSVLALHTGNDVSEFKTQIVWFNVFLFVILHSSIPVGLYMLYSQFPVRTFVWMIYCGYVSGLGVTAGTHRLWSHRSYKAKLPVEILLMLMQTMAGQNSIYTWCRDHRVHHKFAETNADPHNIKRGFFFAHMGWLCCRKHPDVKAKGALIDMSDLKANSVVMFQHRNFWWLSIVFNMLAPTLVPVYMWNERFWTSFVFTFMIRYALTLHGTWLVNSAAHYHGTRPYDIRIDARESPAAIFTGLGEGFHNYHHAFPYDYAASEFGKFYNITTVFIDLCASLGLVYGRRKVDPAIILRRRARTGDMMVPCDEEEDHHY